VLLLLLPLLIIQPATAAAPAEERVRAFVQAFNDRKIDAMLEHAAEGIQWINLDASSMNIEAEGKEALRGNMTKYFQQCPTCRSELVWVRSAGSRVTALERASWKARTGAMSQSSLSVYEFKDGLILRVYYFPAEKDAPSK
jgi:hypothetical protein